MTNTGNFAEVLIDGVRYQQDTISTATALATDGRALYFTYTSTLGVHTLGWWRTTGFFGAFNPPPLNTFNTSAPVSSMACVDGLVYVAIPSLNQVRAINPGTQELLESWTVQSPVSMAADDAGVWVSTSGGTVERRVYNRPNISATKITGGSPGRVLVAEGRVYVADSAAAVMYSFNADGTGGVQTTALNGIVRAMTFTGRHLVVSIPNSGNNTSSVFAFSLPNLFPDKSFVLSGEIDIAVFDGKFVNLGSTAGAFVNAH